MDGNPLLKLRTRGQSVWLDDIHRRMLADNSLARMIETDGITGLTSNPAIFAHAIMSQAEYRAAVAGPLGARQAPERVYEDLVVQDIRRAAQLFQPVYRDTAGADGFVTVEVSPHLAHNTDALVREGLRLWGALECENALIAVPSTAAGVAALSKLVAAGVNVNATRVFSVARYHEVARAYCAGLEERVAQGASIDRAGAVASVFVSQVDVLVDQLLDEHAGQGRVEARALRGRTATALAAQICEAYQDSLATPRWRVLARRGAPAQRLVWASLSTKDVRYSDVKYVEALIAEQTVCTLPLETLAAFRDHGKVGAGIAAPRAEAARVLRELSRLNIDMGVLAPRLEAEGVRRVLTAYDDLQRWLDGKRYE